MVRWRRDEIRHPPPEDGKRPKDGWPQAYSQDVYRPGGPDEAPNFFGACIDLESLQVCRLSS